jgi:SNF2 family DNA or RNA helicase
MDLTQAAHGLNVCSASRVYFVNPVWTPAIEAQALKRAHRIGQMRPVYCETLILKGTLEEEMVKRRNSMTDKEMSDTQDSIV